MGLMPAKDGNNYGFEYVRYPGTEKRFLNVQLLQASMDAPKIIGSFPCKKVPD
ncbi:Putative secreted protein (fragment) [Klebsiella pneumoniae]